MAVAEVLSQSSEVKSATLAVPHYNHLIFRYLIMYLETRNNLLKISFDLFLIEHVST
jgi:hypothetical protein